MNKKKKHKPYFKNKTCDICKQPAKLFRSIKNENYVLCDSKKCDLITKTKAGFFNGINT